MKKAEQIDPHQSSGKASRKVNKKISNRGERRAAKKDPENTPTKRGYRGYES